MSAELHLTACHIGILRNHTPIVRGLDLDIAAGHAYYLRGDNGSGKTTLLQALAGLLAIQAGSIERHVPLIYLGHRPGIKGVLCVRENLALAARLYHQHQPDNAELERAIAAVGLSRQMMRQTRHLSAGQQRRTQLARLWLPCPPLWLLDEPLTALDVHAAAALAAHCRAHVRAGGSLVVTSHQPFDFGDIPLTEWNLSP
ncbi:MAG: heme ABC exporter ATP-binding protein CcmA [Cardiobacteriaceae bacterium]|nr:heme ABC exporter ATP-binding protein CcmA [Cardiobacteriaceae bacterium]